MKAYFIFVLVLTIAYIVYYAIMITKDLHENGEKKKSEEEEFDVSELMQKKVSVWWRTRRDSMSGTTSMRHTTLMKHSLCRTKKNQVAKAQAGCS